MARVILMGDLNVDMTASVGAYPARGGDALVDSLLLHTGGSAINTALALAGLGAEVGFIGRVGTDALAAEVLACLRDAGVDTRQVQFDALMPTGLIFIAVTADGERTMFSSRGANVYTDPGQLDPDYFVGASWFHLSGYALLAEPQRAAALTALNLATAQGCQISLDAGTEAALHARGQIYRFLPHIHLLFPSRTELSLLTAGALPQRAPAILLEKGVGAVVVKLGAEGCEVVTPELRVALPAFDIAPRDTTGAGDSFDAGVIMGRLYGLSWEEAAILGNAAGAISIQHLGAGAAAVTRQAVGELIQAHLDNPNWREQRAALLRVLAFLQSPQLAQRAEADQPSIV